MNRKNIPSEDQMRALFRRLSYGLERESAVFKKKKNDADLWLAEYTEADQVWRQTKTKKKVDK
jgi:hypothetical protein